MNKYAYFPGCSLQSSARDYDHSTRLVASRLGIELVEVPDWNCCGASSARSLDHQLDLALNARNLVLASKLQLDTVIPCTTCYQRLASTRLTLQEDRESSERISQVIGEDIDVSTNLKSLLEVFTSKDILSNMQREAQKSLSGLKVVAYYGCQVTRPPQIGFDDPESPVSMDNLVECMGGESLPWPYKTECCGARLSLTEPDVSLRLIERLLEMAKECGADCIVTACPLCQENLDARQLQLIKKAGRRYDLPVLYFTQLMGMVLGLNYKQMGLNRHFIDPAGILQRVGLS